MKGKRKKRRLLFQITAIVLPLFAVMTAAVVWTVYHSMLKGYLEAQNDHIEDVMTQTLGYMPFVAGKVLDQDSKDWIFQHMEEYRIALHDEVTDEEPEKLKAYLKADNKYEYSWFENMPEDIRYSYIRQHLNGTKNILYNHINNSSFDSMFIMDMQQQYRGLILIDFNRNEQNDKMGSYLELDLSKHPVLEKMLDSDSDKIVFERATDFPNAGNYYIGYKPVIIGGKTRAVVGITYNWDDFRSTLTGMIAKALIIIISGILIVLMVLLIFLYRKAVKPINAIQDGLLDYSADKDPKEIVKKMYTIKEKNELGYLADVISDFTLEIDFYTRENLRTQKELYDAKLQIMVSQIRPHFMYNALTSIAMMCELDPKTAKEATIAFSKYLRCNMDSLSQTKTVPFEQELSHLKNYLFIEKLRFDDLLNIEYDIQVTDFRVPQLSIQPLVENAVKHGVGMAEDGGTVKISTRQTDNAYEVIISDDGVGFDVNAPKKDDGRSHVGMENTRKRLKEMCGADIIITSKIGEGTTARVIIPKERRNENEDTVS
ncbi:histidine kinase [Ruminococcus sp. FC2018]|uniref:sensor histidine kinase n=1 Tax=Ruminococcus sp. FC2018 TaxID=1410617 RepID=UPI000685F70A|nr:histidine kinase [Ruminococcus sp. FC2018]